MTKEELRDAMLRLVIDNFLKDWKPTTRKRLVVEFQDSPAAEELLSECDRSRLLVRDSRGAFLPPAIAFHFAASEEQLRVAKQSFCVIAETLRGLYFADVEEHSGFSREIVLNQMQKLDPSANDYTLTLGFYFLQEFNLSGGYAPDQSGIIQTFHVPEHLAWKKDFDAEWDEGMRRQMPRQPEQPPEMNLPQLRIPPSAFSFVAEDEEEPPEVECLNLDSETIHSMVREIARTRVPHNLADAVEASLKEFNCRVRQIVKAQTGKEYDGADLMQRAFSLKDPVLRLGDLDTTDGRNMQVGYQQIFSGAMTGIRNPKAHGNIEISRHRAMQFLVLVSLMMEKLDEAIENSKPHEAMREARTSSNARG